MDIKEIKTINKELTKAISEEVEWISSRADDDINSQLEVQSKLSDLLRVLRIENGRQ